MNRISKILVVLLFGIVCFSTGQEVVSLPKGESAIVNGSFNAPGNRLTGWLPRSGGLGKFELTEPQTGSPDPVLTITVKAANPKPWLMELRQPVRKTVEKGCTMYITFEYKMTKGYSFQFYWQQERPPWPKLLSMRLTTPENEWHRIRVAAPVHETYQPETTAFSFHLAEAPGILQLRNFYAVMVPNDYNPELLETNETAVLGGDFYDREWREKVTNQMMRTRSVPLTVQVYRRRPKSGNSKYHPPASKAVVIMKQTSRPFKLGVSAPVSLLYPELLSKPEHRVMRERLGEHLAAAPAYKSLVIGNPLFSVFTSRGLFTWNTYESWGKGVTEQLSADLSAAGMSWRGGYLYTPLFSTLQPGMDKMDRTEANTLLQANITKTVSSVTGKVSGWAVVNDAIANADVYNYIGVDSLAQAFASARKGDGAARMYLSDSHALSAISEIPLQDMIELAIWLGQTAGVKIDGLMLDGCMRRLDVGPQTLEKRLDAIAHLLPGVPIHIVNLSVNMDKEDLQSEMLRDYMLLFYSHPAVASVSLGELWTPAGELPTLGYLKNDFTPKRSYQMIQKLMTEDWVSVAEMKMDDDGLATCQLFGGTYDVTVAHESTTKKFTIAIPEGGHPHVLATEPLKGDGYTLTWHPKKGLQLKIYLPMAGRKKQSAAVQPVAKPATQAKVKPAAPPVAKPAAPAEVKPAAPPVAKPAAPAEVKPAAQPAPKK